MSDSPTPLVKIPFPTAAEAVPGFQSAAVPDLAEPLTLAPLAFLEWLAVEGHWPTVWSFLANALPRREAVWWASRCVRAISPPELPPVTDAALKGAETWAAAPGDVNRRKAMPLAEAVGFDQPAGCVALAAFLSGGSLTPPPNPEVAPPANAFARAVAGAVQLAATVPHPEESAATARRLLDLGLAVARGTDRWPDSR